VGGASRYVLASTLVSYYCYHCRNGVYRCRVALPRRVRARIHSKYSKALQATDRMMAT